MELKELLNFIDLENDRLIAYYNDKHLSKEKQILYRTVKLGEEFGELCDEILKSSASQRQEKLDQAKKEDLPDEFADVLFATLLLAKSLDLDVETAIKGKMEKINRRY